MLQDSSCLPVNIQIQLKGCLSLEVWSCLKCSTCEKREALFVLYYLSSAQWRHLSFCEKPSLRRALGSGRNSHPWSRIAGIMTCCQSARHTAHLLVQTGGNCSYDDFYVLLGRTYTLLALGICCCSIFVLITGVKGNQGLLGFFIGEIQIKLNKWTPAVGYILEGLKKGKRPYRGWRLFLWTLYITQDHGSEHLRFVRQKSDIQPLEITVPEKIFHLCFGEPKVFF